MHNWLYGCSCEVVEARKLKIPIWLAAALLLAIVFIGVPVANYHAETLYDLSPRFIHEMALVPLLLFILFDAITLSLVRVAPALMTLSQRGVPVLGLI